MGFVLAASNPVNSPRNLHLRALCVFALSSPALSLHSLSFQPLTDIPPQRRLLNSFAINPLRTLFVSTEGVPPSGPPRPIPYSLCPISFPITLLRPLLHSAKSQLHCFQSIPPSLPKTPGGG